MKLLLLPVPAKMQGENLLDIIQNKVPERNDFFYEHTYQKSPALPQVEGVVSKRFKYMKFIEHNYKELYDIRMIRTKPLTLPIILNILSS